MHPCSLESSGSHITLVYAGYLTRIDFQTICDVTNHLPRPTTENNECETALEHRYIHHFTQWSPNIQLKEKDEKHIDWKATFEKKKRERENKKIKCSCLCLFSRRNCPSTGTASSGPSRVCMWASWSCAAQSNRSGSWYPRGCLICSATRGSDTMPTFLGNIGQTCDTLPFTNCTPCVALSILCHTCCCVVSQRPPDWHLKRMLVDMWG